MPLVRHGFENWSFAECFINPYMRFSRIQLADALHPKVGLAITYGKGDSGDLELFR